MIPGRKAKTVEPVHIPKGMVFPVNERGPVVLPVATRDGENYTLQIGGVSPLGGSPDQLSPAMNFRHQRLLFRMLEHAGSFHSPESPIGYSDLLASDGFEQRRQLPQAAERAWRLLAAHHPAGRLKGGGGPAVGVQP